MITINMEIMQEKDKPDLKESDDLLSKSFERKIPNGREIGKIVVPASKGDLLEMHDPAVIRHG